MRNYYLLLLVFVLIISACKKEEAMSARFQTNETSDWMSELIRTYSNKEVRLIDICIPGSHDAAMFLVRDCTIGANSCNTQTQYLDFSKQLEAGLRIFDIRPIVHRNKFFTQHATDCDGLGCKGEQMEKLIDDTKAFLDQHAEVVIWSLGHFCKMSGNDATFLELLQSKLGERIYKDTDPSIPLILKPLKDILPTDLKTGKVILVFENGFEGNAENKRQGFFTLNDIPSSGGWSNKNKFDELKADQLRRYDSFNPDGNRLFSFSWHMTQDATQAVNCALYPNGYSIQKMAIETNSALPLVVDSLITAGSISSSKIPNMLWVDDGDEAVTRVCIKINDVSLR